MVDEGLAGTDTGYAMALLMVIRGILELGAVLAVVVLLGLIWLFDLDPERPGDRMICDG